MRPAPREPSKQLNAKSLPVTKRRAASGVRLSAQAEPAASKIKTTIANRVTIPDPPPLRPGVAALGSTNCPSGIAILVAAAEGNSARLRWPLQLRLVQRPQGHMLNASSSITDPDHDHGKCYRIIFEPISPSVHDTPPGSRFISRTGGETRFSSSLLW